MRGTGTMLAVGMSVERAESICTEISNKANDKSSVVIAAINGPNRYPFFIIF